MRREKKSRRHVLHTHIRDLMTRRIAHNRKSTFLRLLPFVSPPQPLPPLPLRVPSSRSTASNPPRFPPPPLTLPLHTHVLANGPRARRVHRSVGAAGEGVNPRRTLLLHLPVFILAIFGGVEWLDVDALGGLPNQGVGHVLALDLYRGGERRGVDGSGEAEGRRGGGGWRGCWGCTEEGWGERRMRGVNGSG